LLLYVEKYYVFLLRFVANQMFMEIFSDMCYNNPAALYFIFCEVEHYGSKTNIGLLPFLLKRYGAR